MANSKGAMHKRRPPEVVSKNMPRIRSSDTEIERLARSSLWKMGYRYRKNCAKLPGKPDIVFVRERIAVFCDSDFKRTSPVSIVSGLLMCSIRWIIGHKRC